jgi:hypothetical protein
MPVLADDDVVIHQYSERPAISTIAIQVVIAALRLLLTQGGPSDPGPLCCKRTCLVLWRSILLLLFQIKRELRLRPYKTLLNVLSLNL